MNQYKTLDYIKTRIPDCLVKYNKTGIGSGEARLYVGGAHIRDWDEFFGNYKLQCFFTKKDLVNYMSSAEFEYINQSQPYRRDISIYWQNYIDELQYYPDKIYFNIFRNNDDNNTNTRSRFYIKSNDSIYDYFRRISLPNITSLLIQKVFVDDEFQLWFRLYLDDIGYDFEQQIEIESIEKIERDDTITETEKQSIIKARIGQGKFRELIISKYKSCIITGIDDERILVAGHIKPWMSSNNHERLSMENGLLLSPTYDKLFDRGFLSFRNSGQILLSNHFSEKNFNRANLSNGKKYNIKITNEMKRHLEYHRDMILIK